MEIPQNGTDMIFFPGVSEDSGSSEFLGRPARMLLLHPTEKSSPGHLFILDTLFKIIVFGLRPSSRPDIVEVQQATWVPVPSEGIGCFFVGLLVFFF